MTSIIHQFHFSAGPADAVTNHMFFIRESLRQQGIGGDIFAQEIKGTVASGPDRVLPFLPGALRGGELLLIHHSHGNPILDAVLAEAPAKALVYHNITPAEFFAHDAYLADLCNLGRKQLLTLRPKIVGSFAVSPYNAWELQTLGFGRSELFPLLDLSQRELSTTKRLPKIPRATRQLLFVGKLAPHKNQAQLLKVQYYLRKVLDYPTRLVLVGGEDPIYGRYLRLQARALGIETDVDFAGKVTSAALEAHFAKSDLFLCLSRHEGFCVPLVEAMAAGLPIAAIPNTGIRGTLGASGLHLLTHKPEKIAEIIAAFLDTPEAVQTVLGTQAQRFAALKRFQTRKNVQRSCAALIQRLRNPTQSSASKEFAHEPDAARL